MVLQEAAVWARFWDVSERRNECNVSRYPVVT